MYEENSKRTALSGKEMRILHHVVGHDTDAKELLNLALRYAKKRVVVKRSLGAAPLMPTNIVYRGSLLAMMSTWLMLVTVTRKIRPIAPEEERRWPSKKVYNVYGLGNACRH